jgi:hypothetical protein
VESSPSHSLAEIKNHHDPREWGCLVVEYLAIGLHLILAL